MAAAAVGRDAPGMIRSLALLIVLVAAVAALAPAASAKSCARGEIPWKLAGRTSCAPAPRPAAGNVVPNLAGEWVRSAAKASRRMPRRLRRAVPKVAASARTLVANGFRGRARAAAVRGPVTGRVTAPPIITNDGTTITASATVTASAEDGTDMRLELSAKDRDGYTATYRPIVEGLASGTAPVGCPSAAGVVTADESVRMGGTMIVAKRGRVLESATTRATATVHARGRVGADARLQRVDSDVAFKLGEYRRGSQVEFTVRTALTAGREGAATISGTPTVSARVRTAGASAAEERAEEHALAREAARDRNLISKVAALVDGAHDRLLAGEPGWYELPNHCADVVFAPEPIASVKPDETRQVAGRVVTARGEDAAAGVFTIIRVGRGGFQATRAASASGAPALFSATGGEPDSWKETVSADVVVTSTAGRAARGWSATGEREAFPWRLHGPVSSTQTALGWKATFDGTVTYDLQAVTPNGDGSVTATYDMTAYDLPRVFNHMGDGCGFEGAGAGSGWTSGALELTRAQDGSVTYTLLVDVKIADVPLHWVGCQQPEADFAGALQAYLSTVPRPAEPGFRLRAAGATDATSPNADAVTASWDLTPCSDPLAGPLTAGCAG
ncbi:MAG TPA: hypothetical protein VNS09_10840 [Solirubrobacter sp.]|nr:hypothetical protein [Solirubrobacter sp.]